MRTRTRIVSGLAGGVLAAIAMLWVIAGGSAPAVAQEQPFPNPISFQQHIGWIVAHNCIQCHDSKLKSGGLLLDTHANLMKGGNGGAVIVPGKPEESKLYQMLTGQAQPQMPLGQPLTARHQKVWYEWIKAGAKADIGANVPLIGESAAPRVQVPNIPVQIPVQPQVASLAWSQDGAILAVGLYREVRLLDPQTGAVLHTLAGHEDKVHSLVFNPEGTVLAAAGGQPAVRGEIKLWSIPDGREIRTLRGHDDYIFSAAWSPDGKQLVSASYDKVVKIWNAETGEVERDLKDHADPVFAVAWSPDGNLIASGAADRSVKVWDPKTGKRLYTLDGHGDTVLAVRFNAKSDGLYSIGADKTLRTWSVNNASGKQTRSTTAHNAVATGMAVSNDGNMIATVGEDRSVKLWNAGNGRREREIGDQAEALLSVAFSLDGKEVAVGSYDGSLKVFQVEDGALARTLIAAPGAPAEPADQTARKE